MWDTAVMALRSISFSSEEQILFLTVGDGLSGAYQTAMGAKNPAKDPQGYGKQNPLDVTHVGRFAILARQRQSCIGFH